MKLLNIIPSTLRNRFTVARNSPKAERVENESTQAPAQASSSASDMPENGVRLSDLIGNPSSQVTRAIYEAAKEAAKPLSIHAESFRANLGHLSETRPLLKAIRLYGQIDDRHLEALDRFVFIESVSLADLGTRGKNANIEARMKFFAETAEAHRKFSAQGLEQLAKLPDLCKLDLHRLLLTAEDFEAIGKLSGLVRLDMSCCHLRDDDPAKLLDLLRPLHKLEELNLACIHDLPSVLESLHALPALKKVDLRCHTRLDDRLSGYLLGCPRLKSVKVYEAQVSPEIRALLERRDITVRLAPAL